MQKTEIPISKAKIGLSLFGAVLFVLASYYMLTGPVGGHFSPAIVRGVAIAGLLFFGAIAVLSGRKLFDRAPGLIVDENGITDRSNATSVGFIDWNDVTGVTVEQVMTTRFLLIHVQNPHHYIEKAGSFRRRLLAANFRRYGTPISITSNTLAYDTDKLARLIESNLKEFQSQTASP
jgi:hypothetical protein